MVEGDKVVREGRQENRVRKNHLNDQQSREGQVGGCQISRKQRELFLLPHSSLLPTYKEGYYGQYHSSALSLATWAFWRELDCHW